LYLHRICLAHGCSIAGHLSMRCTALLTVAARDVQLWRSTAHPHHAVRCFVSQALREKGLKTAVYDVPAEDLAGFARRLAREPPAGEDPVEREKTWDAIAFQAEGVADQLRPRDALALLLALAKGSALVRHSRTQSALLQVLLRGDRDHLKPQKVARLWVALDRVDAACSEEAASFFDVELCKALPEAVRLPDALKEAPSSAPAGKSGEGDDSKPGLQEPVCLRGTEKEWQRANALLAASSCSPLELGRMWRELEAATLKDASAVRALPADGLVSALRSAALAESRADTKPSPELLSRLFSHAVAQSKWLDGWASSHTALAAANLGASPGDVYDRLRSTIISRCRLRPKKAAPILKVGRIELARVSLDDCRFAEANRVAAALAQFDVHDAEVRDQIASWLVRPLPPKHLVELAGNLAQIGFGDEVDPQIARHVRARVRSSEVLEAVGAEKVKRVLTAYGYSEDD